MKNLLLLCCTLLFSSALLAQTPSGLSYHIKLKLNDSTSTDVAAGYPIWVYEDYGTFSMIHQIFHGSYSGHTHPGQTITADIFTYDCMGNRVSRPLSLGISDSVVRDTLYLNCDSIVPGIDGSFQFQRLSSQKLEYQFSASSTLTALPAQAVVEYHWTFGDGNTGTGKTIQHTYATPGAYTVELEMTVVDSSAAPHPLFRKTVKDTVHSGYYTCFSKFEVDTSLSNSTSIFVWNNSLPDSTDPQYSTTYLWSFGDGSFSNHAHPQHTYQAPGLYELCLEVTSIDNSGDTCASVFCDSIGVDSAGNVFYKQAGGFTLNVLNPSVGLPEDPGLNLSVFPNPVQETLKVDVGDAGGGTMRYMIWNMRGERVMRQSVEYQTGDILKIRLDQLPRGFYFLQLRSDHKTHTEYIVKD